MGAGGVTLVVPLPASGMVVVVDAAAGLTCAGCQRAVALLVVRPVGSRRIARCLACDLGAA